MPCRSWTKMRMTTMAMMMMIPIVGMISVCYARSSNKWNTHCATTKANIAPGLPCTCTAFPNRRYSTVFQIIDIAFSLIFIISAYQTISTEGAPSPEISNPIPSMDASSPTTSVSDGIIVQH